MSVAGEAREPGVEKLTLSVEGPGGPVPAVAWVPAETEGPRPAVLIGHGGGMHKESRFVAWLGQRLAGRVGYTAVAIDLPHHGERTPPDEAGLSAMERRSRMGLDAWRERNSLATAQAVADWRATIDAAQELDVVQDAPIGYVGLSMGTRFGIPLAAAERRISVAVFGLFGLPPGDSESFFGQAARQVRIPVLYLLQWDDELFPRQDGIALFDLIGSDRKTMHANLGGHIRFPPAEVRDIIDFLRRHLSGQPDLVGFP